MKFLRSTMGYMVAGVLVMSIWDAFVGELGLLGGYFAAFAVIAPMWFMNHYIGLIENKEGHAFVDMALGIGIAGMSRDFFLKGAGELVSSLPTLALVMIGAVVGGLVAAMIEKDMEKQSADNKQDPGYGASMEYVGGEER